MKFKLCESFQADTVTLEYPELCINYNDNDVCLQDYTYEINDDDVIDYIKNDLEKLTNKYPEWENLYDLNFDELNEIEPKLIQFIKAHFDELLDMYMQDLLNYYEDAAKEQAEETYEPDDYVDWDNLPGGHDYM